MKYLISIVIPAYNEEKLIGKCIEAVANQSFHRNKYEILVIDNNSTDNTAEIAKKAGATVISYREKQGFSVAKQFGSYIAKGEIIAYTDADSIPDKNWLEEIYSLMLEKELVCVGGTILSSDKKNSINMPFIFFDYFARINQLFYVSLIWSPNMAVRKKAFINIDGFDTRLKTSDDWDLVMRLQKKYGRKSTLYSSKLMVRTSPRKQKKLGLLIPYVVVGFFNYVLIFVFKKSKTLGNPASVR